MSAVETARTRSIYKHVKYLHTCDRVRWYSFSASRGGVCERLYDFSIFTGKMCNRLKRYNIICVNFLFILCSIHCPLGAHIAIAVFFGVTSRMY